MHPKPLDIYLRLDAVTKAGMTVTVVINGHESGHLVLVPQSYQLFGATLVFGTHKMGGHVVLRYDQIEWDDAGVFRMPARRVVKTVEGRTYA